MSVATDTVPEVYIPPQARPRGQRGAPVLTLVRPLDTRPRPVAPAPRTSLVAPPLRLTRRGIHAVVAVVALVAGLLVLLAWASAPAVRPAPAAPASVSVQAGDTLWSIAARVAPGRDPRQEVSTLQRLNGLSGVALVPGQVLRTR